MTVTGVVTDANTGRPIGGVEVVALTAAVARAGATTTDGNGYYSFVLPSATALSVGYRKDAYNYQSSTVTFTAATRRDIRLVPFWTRSGTGANVFDLPTYVSRVKITGVLTGGVDNFVVWIAGRLVVNEIIGNRSGYQQRFEGTYLTSGGVVEVKYSNGVAWTFEQVQ